MEDCKPLMSQRVRHHTFSVISTQVVETQNWLNIIRLQDIEFGPGLS